ncbi:MAG: protein phosphatase 2C domain-containing protein [Lachnospiraceae bacterium]|nr:protein phosphatase 2C domain-containing protein [Lachnospiraceae bacterium]
MGNYYAFNTTVEGHLHQMKKIPCQDYSESYSDERGRFHIAVVADGHGDAACMRSAEGSRRAAEIAKDCLVRFARDVDEAGGGYGSIREQLSIGRYGERVLQQLTNTIISCWYSSVGDHLCRHELTPDEKARAGQYEELYRRGDRLEHIYGTTLLAAVMFSDYLILLQQGDGRCDVFYEDGTVDQPIPWDDRCHENVTTSMCDEDVAASIRSCVINFKDNKVTAYSSRQYEQGYCERDLTGGRVVACYLGSDGVEDSYRNMEGTHMFYRQLTCDLYERGKEGFGTYLKEWLPDFSRQGSGDDVSVSGIVDLERIGAYVPSFQKQISLYTQKESLDRYESRKISMSRKDEMLRRRSDETEDALREKQRQLLDFYQKEKGTKEEYGVITAQAAQAEQELRDYMMQQREEWETGQKEKNDRQGHRNIIGKKLSAVFSPIGRPRDNNSLKNGRERHREAEDLMEKVSFFFEKMDSLEEKLSQQKKMVSEKHLEVKEARAQSQRAKTEYEEYHREYQAVQAEIDRIGREMQGAGKTEGPCPTLYGIRETH